MDVQLLLPACLPAAGSRLLLVQEPSGERRGQERSEMTLGLGEDRGRRRRKFLERSSIGG